MKGCQVPYREKGVPADSGWDRDISGRRKEKRNGKQKGGGEVFLNPWEKKKNVLGKTARVEEKKKSP